MIKIRDTKCWQTENVETTGIEYLTIFVYPTYPFHSLLVLSFCFSTLDKNTELLHYKAFCFCELRFNCELRLHNLIQLTSFGVEVFSSLYNNGVNLNLMYAISYKNFTFNLDNFSAVKPVSVFEERVSVFKEESTPVQFSTATSLSDLTFDDEQPVSTSFQSL